MPKKKIYFLAPLANVDSSIFKMNFKHGFKIKDIPIWDYCKFISKMEGTSPESVSMHLTRNLPYLLDCSKSKIYIVENTFDIKKVQNPISQEEILSSECHKFQSELVHKYFNSTIKKMRLFKEGNIFIPFYYIYSKKNNNPHTILTVVYSYSNQSSNEKYTIVEVKEINRFINKIKLPFKYPFLQLAFDNFELSYHIQNKKLAFLSLMISLESLFHPSNEGELTYRISRNIAVLLGRTKKYNSNCIFVDVKDLYKKRSKIVHAGEKVIIKNEDLLKLRDFVRESIKMIYITNKKKTDLLKLLNSSGFNEDFFKE